MPMRIGSTRFSVPRRDATVAKNPPECRYCTRFALNNGERLFEPNGWLPSMESNRASRLQGLDRKNAAGPRREAGGLEDYLEIRQ
jgi:hypothetical protein